MGSLGDCMILQEELRDILFDGSNLEKEDAREGNLDGALEQYATSIVLNMAASLLKKEEFWQVGHLCSVILNHNPKNVKALNRRSCATMGSGKYELACWDLKLAYDLEPSNQKVLKKLSEVE
ncbi:Peptidyl-prolyl cis-trans isomerase FKBP8 [Bienertia sinuspersici]